jgi:uncharacterized protein (TIGR04255 family)
MSDERAESPVFDNPPVIEAVIGVHFVPLIDFTNGHAGWFWRECLGKEWPKAADAPALPEQVERFGENQMFGLGQLGFLGQFGFMLRQTKPADRLQIINADDDRVVQVQNNQFHYNWRKRNQNYPRHRQARGEFSRFYGLFREFASNTGLGTLVPNQWELTYVNHIPCGELWQNPGDWHRVLPGLLSEPASAQGVRLETTGGEWHYEIVPARGRVHLTVQHAKIEGGVGGEVLVFQLLARGEVSDKPGWGLDDGLDRGHAEISRLFVKLTSPEAHRVWGRRS